MSSFVNADLGSDSDSDDVDFDPVKEAGHEGVSEEENSGDEENPGSKKAKKTKKDKNASKRSGGCFQIEEDISEDKSRKEEFEKEKKEIKEMADKKKNEEIWSDFLKDVGGATKKPKKKASGGGLGSITSTAKPKKATNKSKKTPSSISSIFDSIGTDVTKEKVVKEEPPSLMSSIFEAVKKQETKKVENQEEETESKSEDKMKITQVFDFAGETVEVTKEVDKDSKEAKKFIKDQEKPSAAEKRPAGLGSIMGVISGKKPKMGTLDKSKIDWDSYVKEEGIKEELETHNKGKDGYVEKQMFLERADYRRFEIEKAAREKSRKSLTK